MGSPAAGSKPAVFLLLVVVALAAGAGGASAATFLVTNMCPFPVWPAAIPSGGSTGVLNPGQVWLFRVPPGTKDGRIWGRTGCHFTGDHGQCATGDCAGALRCEVPENPPAATLAEFTLGGGGGAEDDLYDISVADGFNLPMSFTCDDRSGEDPAPIRCEDAGCPDANHRAGEGKVRTCKADRVYHNHRYFVVFCPNE
ncbi:hypothetical protein SETIT_3G398900v2 [Setaria italica]|uniref:Thaumatin-like protein n=1 Tax=Setaria italica TaxID=4555 RepID=K3Z9T4_SETIT|nr:thaumatin-like pathogenesis-related protein 4 [Setaria italica]RCV19603.1 hypothetical protein SETIT_3G398900v2 [Setaria italica]